jgi:hypothetical protein
MGGIGSGQWTRRTHKPGTDEFFFVDIRAWNRHRELYQGSSFEIRCEAGWPSVGVERTSLLVARRCRPPVRVFTERTPCTFGGARVWFVCPNERCKRRTAYLYFKDDTIGCGICFGLGYASQRKRAPARNLDKARRLRRRLTATEDFTLPLPPRPAGMHSKTYAALLAQATQVEARLVDPLLGAAQVGLGVWHTGMPDIAECHLAGGTLENDAERLCRMLWRIAQLPPERTKGSILGQLRAIDAIARLKGFIE